MRGSGIVFSHSSSINERRLDRAAPTSAFTSSFKLPRTRLPIENTWKPLSEIFCFRCSWELIGNDLNRCVFIDARHEVFSLSGVQLALEQAQSIEPFLRFSVEFGYMFSCKHSVIRMRRVRMRPLCSLGKPCRRVQYSFDLAIVNNRGKNFLAMSDC